jgi:hypothetical protein
MSPNPITSEILGLEKRRCKALLTNDVALLSELLSDRLVFMHANAAADDKAALLAKMTGGRIVYKSLDVSEETVIGFADFALLFSRLRADVLVGDQLRAIDNRTLSVWAREDEGWRLIAYQPTPVPK